MTTISTYDDVKDLALNIVDGLVSTGLIDDCIDTDDQTEFEYQDSIRLVLADYFDIIEES